MGLFKLKGVKYPPDTSHPWPRCGHTDETASLRRPGKLPTKILVFMVGLVGLLVLRQNLRKFVVVC